MEMSHNHRWIGLLLCLFTSSILAATPPKVMLAKVYQQKIDLNHYWVSEKLDGVRAYWDGRQLKSRQGNIYHAPIWFTAHFPDQPLDGELWIGRNSFQQLVSTVRKLSPKPNEWQQVKYMAFDLPGSNAPFTERIDLLKQLIESLGIPHLKLVKQSRVADHKRLMQRLDQIVADGGEGLMLHHGDSLYRSGRSDNLLKVKRHQDAEAVVVKHLPGKGKFSGLLGAVEVEMPDGKRFRIGSGFNNRERQNPPPIGSTISYKYFGLTQKGIPRFATFLRKRCRPGRANAKADSPQ